MEKEFCHRASKRLLETCLSCTDRLAQILSPVGEGLISFRVRLSELTSTLNKNSSTNRVGEWGEPFDPRLQTRNKILYLLRNFITSIGTSFKGMLHLKHIICDTHSGMEVHMKQTRLFTVDSQWLIKLTTLFSDINQWWFQYARTNRAPDCRRTVPKDGLYVLAYRQTIQQMRLLSGNLPEGSQNNQKSLSIAAVAHSNSVTEMTRFAEMPGLQGHSTQQAADSLLVLHIIM